jgi:hypothetical protein
MLFLIFNLHYFCRHGTEMRASRNHSILQINITGKKNILIYAIVKSIILCPSKPVFNNVETLCSKKIQCQILSSLAGGYINYGGGGSSPTVHIRP